MFSESVTEKREHGQSTQPTTAPEAKHASRDTIDTLRGAMY